MEIWDERVRLQDARNRAERLAKAFEPTSLAPREPRPHVHRHRHVPHLHGHIRLAH